MRLLSFMRLLSYKGFTIPRKKDIWPLPSHMPVFTPTRRSSAKKLDNLKAITVTVHEQGQVRNFKVRDIPTSTSLMSRDTGT